MGSPVSAVGAAIDSGQLNPAFVYLHAQPANAEAALGALGFADQAGAHPVLTWYFSDRQTIQTRNGHWVAIASRGESFKAVADPTQFDAWPPPGSVQQRVRLWDSPGTSQYGLVDQLVLQDAAPSSLPTFVTRHLRTSLRNPDTRAWRWVRQSGTATGDAWFALVLAQEGQWQVVYSYQCLPSGFCMHLAPWPVAQVRLPS